MSKPRSVIAEVMSLCVSMTTASRCSFIARSRNFASSVAGDGDCEKATGHETSAQADKMASARILLGISDPSPKFWRRDRQGSAVNELPTVAALIKYCRLIWDSLMRRGILFLRSDLCKALC